MRNREDQIEVIWEVQDGYVSGSRPQSTYIPREDYEECETEEEKQELVDEYVREDFLNSGKVSWSLIRVEE